MTIVNYYLVATHQRLCVVASDNGDGPLQLQHSNGRPNAIWQLTPVLGGYLLVDQKFLRCVVAASPTELAHMDVVPNAPDRIWSKVVKSVAANGAETVCLIDQKYGLALATGVNGALSLQDPQMVMGAENTLWTLTPATDSAVWLRSCFGQYVQPGSNGVLTGNTTVPGSTTTFQLIELGGGRVALQASNGMYISGGNGGFDLVASRSDGIFSMENFLVTDLGGGRITLKAANGLYVSADQDGGGVPLKANRSAAGDRESFLVIKQPTSSVCLRSYSGQYVQVDSVDNQTLAARRTAVGGWETFELHELGGGYVALRASNGRYVSALNGGDGRLCANRALGIGPFERFLLTDLGSGTIALQASNGKYVSSDQNAGGVALLANRAQRGTLETFGIVRRPGAFAWETLTPGLSNVSSESDGAVASSGQNSFQWNGNDPAGLIPSLGDHAQSGGNQSWVVDGPSRILRFFNDAWVQVPSGPTKISVGTDGTVWGVNTSRTIFHFTGSGWETIYGALDQISVASASRVCGVNDIGNVYSWHGSGWDQLPGTMRSVSIGSDGTVFSIHPHDGVCQRRGGSWEHVPVNLSQLAVASSELLWGTDPSGALIRGAAFSASGSATSWQRLGSSMVQVAAAADGTVWGISSAGTLSRWIGQWQPIDGALSQISVGSHNHIWGVTAAGTPYRYRYNGLGWEQLPGNMKQVSCSADGTVWALDAADQIFRWNDGWQQVVGALRQISVGSASLIYGVNASGQVFKWNGHDWDAQPGHMKSVSVASDGTVYGIDNNDTLHLLKGGSTWVSMKRSLSQVCCASSGVLWGVDAAGSVFRVSADPVADPTLSVAVQEEQSLTNPAVYRYSTGLTPGTATPGFKQLGAAFVAYSVAQPGTVPIYEETPVAYPGTHYHYWHRSEAEARSNSWMPTRVAFHAFLYPAPGTVPVYREAVTGTSSYHYSMSSPAAAAQQGFVESYLAFYAYPLHALPVSLSLPARDGVYDWTQSFKLPEAGRGIVSFVAETTTEVLLAICAQKETAVELYEIGIDLANSGQTVIRRAAGGAIVASAASGPADPGGSNALWVSINRTTSQIRIGRGAIGQNQILAYTDPAFLADVRYFTFSTGDTPVTCSEISALPLAPDSLSLPAQNRSYDWAKSFRLPAAGSGAIRFAVQTSSDVQLAIAPQRASTGALYEIVIGTASNGQTVIRRAAGGAAVATAATGITNPGGMNRLWVSISRETGMIQIGRDTVGQNVILVYKDPAFLADALYCALTSAEAPVSYSEILTQAVPQVVMKWSQAGIEGSTVRLVRPTLGLPSGFVRPPGVLLATARGGDFSNTYSVGTSGVGVTSSRVNIYRTDFAGGWDPDPSISLLVSDPIVRPNLQCGSSVIGSSPGNLKLQGISFATPFTQAPRVLITARGADSTDSFVVTVTSVSTSGFTANVACVNGQSWTQELRIDWIAFTPDGLTDLHATEAADGTAVIGAGTAAVKRVPVSFNKTFSSAPTLFLTARGEPWGDTFAVTATNITATGFTANVKRVDSATSGWGQYLQLDWLALV